MAEDRHNEGEQLQARLNDLAGQWSKGKVSLKQIVGLSEEELYSIASQGFFLFLQGKTEPARVIFEGLVAVDPRNAYYYRALGAIYWRLKDPQKALKQFTYASPCGATRDVELHQSCRDLHFTTSLCTRPRRSLHGAQSSREP